MTKHFAIAQSRERQTFGCPACGLLCLGDLGAHSVAFQFDLTEQRLSLAKPHPMPTRRYDAPPDRHHRTS